jgi:hypothetical protein
MESEVYFGVWQGSRCRSGEKWERKVERNEKDRKQYASRIASSLPATSNVSVMTWSFVLFSIERGSGKA